MTSPVTFLKEVRLELDRVTWPSRGEVLRLTGIVLAISLAIGLFLGLIDFVFVKVMEILL